MGPSTLFEPLQAVLFLCFWLWKMKENDSPSQTLGVLSVGLAHAVGTSLHHFANGLRLVEPRSYSNGCQAV